MYSSQMDRIRIYLEDHDASLIFQHSLIQIVLLTSICITSYFNMHFKCHHINRSFDDCMILQSNDFLFLVLSVSLLPCNLHVGGMLLDGVISRIV